VNISRDTGIEDRETDHSKNEPLKSSLACFGYEGKEARSVVGLFLIITMSMKRFFPRQLVINTVIDRFLLKNNQIKFFPCFTFILEIGKNT